MENGKEGIKMKKPISEILPNPHRNFDIYPVGETQVELLIDSINDVGMFLGLPARKTESGYEIACGHHRLEALRRTGATHVDLAVNNYSDEDMLKIMIRENSTQRGNENFGAVLDSVGAVLVQCVRVLYKGGVQGLPDVNWVTIKTNITSGEGIGYKLIHKTEPSLSEKLARTALSTFRSTGTYLSLLKKGGLPEQFWHLYEKTPVTKIEAVSMFPKPAHAAAWVRGVEDELFQERFSLDSHSSMVSQILAANDKSTSAKEITEYIRKKLNPNLNLNPDEKDEKDLTEKAEDTTKAIKALLKKITKFKEEKGDNDCYIESIEPIINALIEELEWLMDCRQATTIDV